MKKEYYDKLVLNLKLALNQKLETNHNIFIKNLYWLGFDLHSPNLRLALLQLEKDGYIEISANNRIIKGEKFNEL